MSSYWKLIAQSLGFTAAPGSWRRRVVQGLGLGIPPYSDRGRLINYLGRDYSAREIYRGNLIDPTVTYDLAGTNLATAAPTLASPVLAILDPDQQYIGYNSGLDLRSRYQRLTMDGSFMGLN